MLPENLGHYRILARIGAGGMGEVHRARDTRLGREVALKVLPSDAVSDPDRMARFQREARALAALDHPNIVTVHSVEEADGVHFLTMGLVEGRTLDEAIPENGFPFDTFFDLAVPLSEAVAAAHDRHIVHRDLKPGNIMVTPEGRLKVLDFGLSKLVEPPTRGPEHETKTRLALTREGMILGTIPYMSPEQAENKAVDPRSDIFSLGVIFYEMACGQRPFVADSTAGLLSAILREQPSPVAAIRSGTLSGLNRLILRCLEKNPLDRYQTARDVYNELQALRREQNVQKAPAAEGPEPLSPSSSTDHALAVLPFEDISSGDRTEWFAAGMHEALLTSLQQIRGLRVISRTSVMGYQGLRKPVGEIARELRVRWIVEGSVLHAEKRIRITAKVIDAREDRQVWAEQYDHDLRGILELQSRVARDITGRIDVVVRPEEERRLSRAKKVDPRVFQKYVLGLRHFDRVTPSDFEKSVSLFEEAITLDPDFAPAHAYLAVTFGVGVQYGWVSGTEVADKAEKAARAALAADPGSGDAYYALASVQRDFERDFPAAEQSFKRAIRLTSNSMIHYGYGWLLSQMGRHGEAVASLETAVEMDPQSPRMHGDLGWWLYGNREYERALAEAEVALGLFPDFAEGYWLKAAVYSQLGRFDEALESFDRYEALYGEPVSWFRGYLYGLAGRREDALEALEEERKRVDAGSSMPIVLAHVYLGLGDRDRLLETLERATETGVSFQPYLWPEYEPLFEDPRFSPILRKFGIPAPSR